MTRHCLTCGAPYDGDLDHPLVDDCPECDTFSRFGTEEEYEWLKERSLTGSQKT